MAAAMLAAAAALFVAAGTASASEVIYSNILKPLPGNAPSQNFEATATWEFGGLVKFGATARNNPMVTVGMSSWQCESGSWNDDNCVSAAGAKVPTQIPVTLNIYRAEQQGSEYRVGPEIVKVTQAFTMPYRPSASPKCAAKGEPGEWYRKGTCFNGKMFTIKFAKLGSTKAPVTLPGQVIISVSYNTTDWGYEPTHVPGAVDNLNVASGTTSPATGSDPLPADAFITSSYEGEYCGSGVTLNTFGISTGCWATYQPAIEVQASS
ncbi:MAG: hypothetical protein ACLP50_22660 [Solirubrobacteraceae bacterium]